MNLHVLSKNHHFSIKHREGGGAGAVACDGFGVHPGEAFAAVGNTGQGEVASTDGADKFIIFSTNSSFLIHNFSFLMNSFSFLMKFIIFTPNSRPTEHRDEFLLREPRQQIVEPLLQWERRVVPRLHSRGRGRWRWRCHAQTLACAGGDLPPGLAAHLQHCIDRRAECEPPVAGGVDTEACGCVGLHRPDCAPGRQPFLVFPGCGSAAGPEPHV